MKKRLFEFECPHCHQKFMMVRDTYLLKDAGSEDYAHLKDQTFFVHQCQKCFRLFDLNYPLLYWDPDKDFSVVLTQKKDVENLDSKKSIVCRKPEQFLFAFQCLDLDLDIKKMLVIKRKAEKKFGGPCFLLDWDEKSKAAMLKMGKNYFWVVSDGKFCDESASIKTP